MASSAFLEWLETFRGYEVDELTDRIDELKGQISIFSSQGVGSKNFTRDLNELRTQLSAATRVRNEKGHQNVGSTGLTDFSLIKAESDLGGLPLPDVPTSW